MAVRERGKKHFSKILRFFYNIPSAMSKILYNSIAVKHIWTSSHLLFQKSGDDGRIVIPPQGSLEEQDVVERHTHGHCLVLSIGQRCPDWFILRQLRVTGTSAGEILMRNFDARGMVGLPINSEENITPKELLNSLVWSWFSASRSTETMLCGTANEDAGIAVVSRKPFVINVFQCGMLARKEMDWVACSPDGVALIQKNKLSFSSSNAASDGLVIASVGIKTSVA